MTCSFGYLSDRGGDSGYPPGGVSNNSGNGSSGGYNNGHGSGVSGGSHSGNGNNGYTPVKNERDTFPNSSCAVIDSLIKTPTIRQHLNLLRNSISMHNEKGISFTLPDTSGATHI